MLDTSSRISKKMGKALRDPSWVQSNVQQNHPYHVTRHEHFARPTSGANNFHPRTCQLEAEQICRTGQAITQLLLVTEQSMTYIWKLPCKKGPYGMVYPPKIIWRANIPKVHNIDFSSKMHKIDTIYPKKSLIMWKNQYCAFLVYWLSKIF